jgi:hypothetical protein
VVGSSTLSRGGTVVVSGSGGETTYVLPDFGSAVIVNGKTQAIQSTAVAAPAATTPVIVIGSSTYTANSVSQFVIGSQTLTPGGIITAGVETVSLASGGSSLVVLSGKVTTTESVGGVDSTSKIQSPTTAKASTNFAAGLGPYANDWVIGGCLSIGILGILRL